MKRVSILLVGAPDELHSVRRFLLGEVDDCPREACEAFAAQLAKELRSAEDEDREDEEGHGPGVVLPFVRRESRS